MNPALPPRGTVIHLPGAASTNLAEKRNTNTKTGVDTPESSTFSQLVTNQIFIFLRQEFQRGLSEPVEMDDVLVNIHLGGLSGDFKELVFCMLSKNPKVEICENHRIRFKPRLGCRDGDSLLALLKRYEKEGLGGIYLEDVMESVPFAARELHTIKSKIITISRSDNKKIIFYDNPETRIQIDMEFKRHWKSVSVTCVDDGAIEKYLEKQKLSLKRKYPY